MKVIQAKLGGTPTPGDIVHLHYCAPTGGRTSASHIVKDADTLADILQGMLDSANIYYLGEFDVKAKDSGLMVICSNLVENVLFVPEVLGAKTETLTVTEL